jgi:hypothetical protein
MCEPGTYCANGLSTPTNCPQGYYCPNYASNLQIACPSGYYCPNTGTSDPDDTTNFKLCPVGYYCPKGTISPIQCEAGYYSRSQGATSSSDCDACPAGYSCVGGSNLPYTTDPLDDTASWSQKCTAGYYCAAGSSSVTAAQCSRGYYCPTASVTQYACLPGTYQGSAGQSSCDPCPAGYYCDGVDGTTYTTCPKGFYCPSGTTFSNEYPCPAGTYGASTGLTAASGTGGCTSCTNGYYCQFMG